VYVERYINVMVDRMEMDLMLLQKRTKITSNLHVMVRAQPGFILNIYVVIQGISPSGKSRGN